MISLRRLLGLLALAFCAFNATLLHAADKVVDPFTLTGKVMCGYQGWFNCEGDGAERGWVHWTKREGGLKPGNAKIDLWPDVSELGADERFATGFTNASGKPFEVFSSFKRATVLRHFEWMRDYGIDGALVQRFVVDLQSPKRLEHNNAVLNHCHDGAKQAGRAFAVMYDLSGMGSNCMSQVRSDWRKLRNEMRVTDDAAYLKHRGKPLVTVWGIGFNDQRRYTLAECRELVEWFKAEDSSVMIGVPTYWRERKNDALDDPILHDIVRLADVVSPWTVGRYASVEEVRRYGERVMVPDMAWCAEAKVNYLPVVFPGFSWHNLNGGPLDQIPRRKGAFLWSQFVAAKRAGAQMVYVAMFDEVDEGTAIFKCVNEVPESASSRFVTYEGLPSDYYLKLTGAGGRLLRGEIPPGQEVPALR